MTGSRFTLQDILNSPRVTTHEICIDEDDSRSLVISLDQNAFITVEPQAIRHKEDQFTPQTFHAALYKNGVLIAQDPNIIGEMIPEALDALIQQASLKPVE